MSRLGDVAWFEYHCWESPESGDAEVWYRSHQRVEILGRNEIEPISETMSYQERQEECVPWTYEVRFPDGLVWSAWEDELSASRADWHRPDPPKRGTI
jgi:hypothetical protein